MNRALRLSIFIVGGLLGLFAYVDSAQADEVQVPECVDVTKSAPYRGYGHNHIVHLRSTCEQAVRCEVSTDVTPEIQRVSVEPGQRQDVLTRTGSPASVFEARVDCELVP